MKIKVVSDLHLEFSDIDITNNGCDTLILSGDILLADCLYDFPADLPDSEIKSSRHVQAIRFRNFLRYCSEDFDNVIYVAGNHEFYKGKFYQTLDILKDECSIYPNIHFLENNSVTIDDIVFVGATLWTDCNNNDSLTMFSLPQKMNDFTLIRNDRENFRKLSTTDIVLRHRKTLDYFNTVISNVSPNQKVVVVGHHAPTRTSIHKRYKHDHEMNGGYCSDLSDFILNHPNIALWTHGHVHDPFDYMVGGTRIVCNPRGYEGQGYCESTGWNPDIIIEV